MNIQIISSQRTHSQRGQTFLIIAVFIGVFLLAVMGLATDYAQIWAHRQAAQGAADAACQAGAADLLLDFEDSSSTYSTANAAWIGTAYNCSTNTSSSPCKYAAQNGYTGSNVSVTFPSSLPNAPAIPSTYGITTPYIQVTITDPVPMYFTKLVSSTTTVSTTVKAGCGIVVVNAAIPLAVLSPTGIPSGSASLSVGGNSSIAIYNGPQRSIQVNDHSATALSGGGGIDLSAAGPGNSGGDIGVFGGPTANPGVLLGSTGHYIDPAAPVSNPFSKITAPSSSGMPSENASGVPGTVPYHTNGCPDTSGCVQYVPGYYPGGLTVGPGSKVVAIFDPGVYYVNGGINLKSNSIVRPSAANATTSPYGAIFYLTGCTTSCITVVANSGSKSTTDNFSTTTLSSGGKCTAYVAPPGLVAPTQGNMLMAPCDTSQYGDPSGAGNRGILFFVDNSICNAGAGWGGGGKFIMAGAFYVHNTGAASCGDSFSLGGNSGSGSLIIGNMIVDTLSMSGTPGVTMELNPNSSYPILEVQLLQ
jgi:hypothetical protein